MAAKQYKQRKDGRYYTTVTVGRDYDNGNPVKVTVYGRNKTELTNKVAVVKADYLQGRNIVTKNVLFKKYAEKWLENKKPHIEYKTYLMYENILKLYMDRINNCSMKEIIKSDVQELINDHIDKSRTCRIIKATLNQIFESAIDDNICLRNPSKRIILPKYEPNKKRPLTTTEDILSDITEFNDRERAFILLMKWCGLRPEECLALMKKDFNLENKTIKIRNALEFVNNKPHIKETKTKNSNRTIPLIGVCQTFIPYYLSNLKTEYLFATTKTQELITDSSYRRMWQTIKRKMNRKAEELNSKDDASNLTPYIFRHNYATVLHNLKVSDREIQYLMGHTSIQTTNAWYIHIDPNKLEATKNLIDYAKKKKHMSVSAS